MASYKCINCGRQISNKALEKRFICPRCGKKIFYKDRKSRKFVTKIKAV